MDIIDKLKVIILGGDIQEENPDAILEDENPKKSAKKHSDLDEVEDELLLVDDLLNDKPDVDIDVDVDIFS
jgi:hypothetical protein